MTATLLIITFIIIIATSRFGHGRVDTCLGALLHLVASLSKRGRRGGYWAHAIFIFRTLKSHASCGGHNGWWNAYLMRVLIWIIVILMKVQTFILVFPESRAMIAVQHRIVVWVCVLLFIVFRSSFRTRGHVVLYFSLFVNSFAGPAFMSSCLSYTSAGLHRSLHKAGSSCFAVSHPRGGCCQMFWNLGHILFPADAFRCCHRNHNLSRRIHLIRRSTFFR